MVLWIINGSFGTSWSVVEIPDSNRVIESSTLRTSTTVLKRPPHDHKNAHFSISTSSAIRPRRSFGASWVVSVAPAACFWLPPTTLRYTEKPVASASTSTFVRRHSTLKSSQAKSSKAKDNSNATEYSSGTNKIEKARLIRGKELRKQSNALFP